MRALVLAALLWGCDGDSASFIDGSAASSYDMDFDEVRIRLFSTEVAVEYVRKAGSGEELPLKLTVSFAEDPIAAGQPIDLHPPSGTVNRVPNSPQLPELSDQESTITFETWSTEAGASIEGTFRVDFENGTGLNGAFSADLERPLDE
ncbi:MAG: hypothetical protein HYY06_00535 [Deltaproteobacteria bacterium]|nr:hypothetical protein [Deltaproteobacteria bacterium]